jgi:hypothetical protein
MSARVCSTDGGGASGLFKSGNNGLLSSSIKEDVSRDCIMALGTVGDQGEMASVRTGNGVHLWEKWLQRKVLSQMVERSRKVDFFLKLLFFGLPLESTLIRTFIFFQMDGLMAASLLQVVKQQSRIHYLSNSRFFRSWLSI